MSRGRETARVEFHCRKDEPNQVTLSFSPNGPTGSANGLGLIEQCRLSWSPHLQILVATLAIFFVVFSCFWLGESRKNLLVN